MESGSALFPQHRTRQTTKFAQFGVGKPFELRHVLQQLRIKGRHGIQAEQIQTGHAQMNPIDGPVVKTRHAERTAVAHSLAQHLPGVTKIVAILPDHTQHVAKVLRLGLAQTERHLGSPGISSCLFNSMTLHGSDGWVSLSPGGVGMPRPEFPQRWRLKQGKVRLRREFGGDAPSRHLWRQANNCRPQSKLRETRARRTSAARDPGIQHPTGAVSKAHARHERGGDALRDT